MTMDARPTGPHRELADPAQATEVFLAELFDTLWVRYRERVAHVRSYEQVVQAHGARFVNDHIAFRTFASQAPQTGILNLSRLFETLGYRAANLYYFEDKQLFATHFEHPNHDFPKLFISELQTWRLAPPARAIIERTLADHAPPLAGETLAELARLSDCIAVRRGELLAQCVDVIHTLPWSPPQQADVTALNDESQYGAWVLVHGYNVNHFTSLINSHGVDALGDIEKTITALQGAGVPMKAEIEGAAGSVLRQTATAAAVIDVEVRAGETLTQMPWTYAYFELAERGHTVDASGQRRRFEGFLGAQATHLFEMTRK